MYDGTLLPKRYWGTLIHADPGPNEVRAYPVEPVAGLRPGMSVYAAWTRRP